MNEARAWAWICDFGLCRWAEPTRAMLVKTKKPSPEAKPIRVRLVPVERKARKAKP